MCSKMFSRSGDAEANAGAADLPTRVARWLPHLVFRCLSLLLAVKPADNCKANLWLMDVAG